MLGKFLALADDFRVHHCVVRFRLFALLVFDENVDSVEGEAAVVAYDSAASVRVGKPRDDCRVARRLDVGRVCVEHALIVRLSVFREDFANLRVFLKPVRFARRLYHSVAAERHYSAFERRVGLQTHDDFRVFVDVARLVRVYHRGRGNIGVEAAVLLDFLFHKDENFVPDAFRAVGCGREERAVARVGRVVLLDEVDNIYRLRPFTGFEAVPSVVCTFDFHSVRF